MPQCARIAFAGGVAATICLGIAPPVQSDFGFSNRPHSVVGFREQLVLRRFTASVMPAGASLRVNIDFSARARADTARLQLRAGRCNGGSQNSPNCNASFSLPLTFRSGTRTFVRRTVTVPRPGGTIRALAIWVGKRGQRPWDSAAYLRLPQQTWRFQAGEHFGLIVPREGPILAARADVTGFNTDQAGISVKLTAQTKAPLALKTRVAPCNGSRPECTAVEKSVELMAGPAREYRVGASAKAPHHQVASFFFWGPDGNSPLNGTLPWPV